MKETAKLGRPQVLQRKSQRKWRALPWTHCVCWGRRGGCPFWAWLYGLSPQPLLRLRRKDENFKALWVTERVQDQPGHLSESLFERKRRLKVQPRDRVCEVPGLSPRTTKIKMKQGAGEMARQVKCLLCMNKDLNYDPQKAHVKKLGIMVCCRVELGGSPEAASLATIVTPKFTSRPLRIRQMRKTASMDFSTYSCVG